MPQRRVSQVQDVGLLQRRPEVGGEEALEEEGDESGSCLRQHVADALWELAGRYEVGLWYECGGPLWNLEYVCGVVANGVRLYQLNCFISRRVLT